MLEGSSASNWQQEVLPEFRDSPAYMGRMLEEAELNQMGASLYAVDSPGALDMELVRLPISPSVLFFSCILRRHLV